MLEACGLLMREIGPRVDELGSNPLVLERDVPMIARRITEILDQS